MTVGVMAGVAGPVDAQSKEEKKRQKELQEAMQREARPVVMLIDHLQGQPGTDGVQVYTVNPKESDPAKAFTSATPAVEASGFTLHQDLLKAADGKVWSPYALSFPADALPAGPVSVYVRLTPKGAPLPTERPKEGSPFPWEDFYSAETRATAGQPARVVRAFMAVPGEYDVYFGIRPKPADAKKSKDDPVRVVTFKKTLTLPDFWNGELTTSTVIVAARVETIQSKNPNMLEHPYLFGQDEFIPSQTNKFTKTDNLTVAFFIYNPSLTEGKPDVMVEYNFHQKLPAGEKFFNKTTPLEMNAQTMPPSYDVATVQMLSGTQSVPLGSFPAGDYRLEVKITDKNAKKTLTRDVLFAVEGS